MLHDAERGRCRCRCQLLLLAIPLLVAHLSAGTGTNSVVCAWTTATNPLTVSTKRRPTTTKRVLLTASSSSKLIVLRMKTPLEQLVEENHDNANVSVSDDTAAAVSTTTNLLPPPGAVHGPPLMLLLHKLLRPPEGCDVDRMSGTDLAYIGDVVYELFVRSRTVWPPKRTADLQHQAVALVRAEHQSRLLAKLKDDFALTAKEQQVLNRGRNAASSRNNNRRDPSAYQDSTAFEAILGYVYISNPDRCGELLAWIDAHVDHV